MKSDWRLLSLVWFWEELCSFIVSWLQKGRLAISFYQVSLIMPLKKINHAAKVENVEEERVISLLDWPDLALECVLERLLPAGLCSMAGVCSSLRDRCRSDHLWEKPMKQKWGKLIGDAAYREWQWHLASTKRPRPALLGQNKQKGLLSFVQRIFPLSWIRPRLECD
ncbi:F-box family protein isoform 2 [Tripterygium wilfordii]|uniref:F-box family protein isoform 2 n=1 Tax=Tripterygium wilfordii TaxID=458696 RepID=A0A7J7DNL6_TRIWF|nr:F-box family protein isoform 2 [Tripterygium wilfordii]